MKTYLQNSIDALEIVIEKLSHKKQIFLKDKSDEWKELDAQIQDLVMELESLYNKLDYYG